MNPIPRGVGGDQYHTGRSFPNHCGDSASCIKGPYLRMSAETNRLEVDSRVCRCSGAGETGLGNLEVVDQIRIPSTIPAGSYVLGWRMDCEESNHSRCPTQ